MSLNNIPLPGQSLLQTRDQVNANFTDTNRAFKVNHVEINISGEGKHKFLQMPEQVAPFPTTDANEAALYCAVGATSGVSELVFRRESSPGIIGTIPFTEHSPASPSMNSAGWTYLPSGIMMQWGVITILNQAGNTVVTFPRPFPNACYNVQLTRYDTSGQQQFVQVITALTTAAQFQSKAYSKTGNDNAATVYFFAIGA